MAATLSTGSPKLGKKASSNFVVLDQNKDDREAAAAAPTVSVRRTLEKHFSIFHHHTNSQPDLMSFL
jgi:hypothetical protein